MMRNETLARAWGRLFPNPKYYGWVVVGTGFLCTALSSPGQSFAISLYLESLMADLGLSRVELSSLYAVATLSAAACLPFLGAWADRLPSGRYLGGVLAGMALALFGFAATPSALALGVAFFFLRLLGQGAIGLGTLTSTVDWFRRYRGRALAVVSLGYALGQMVFPGILYALIGGVGWRGSLVVLGLVYLALFAPLVGRLMRDRRATDLPVDGEVIPVGARVVAGQGAPTASERSYSLREALRMPVFWGMLACVSVPPLVMTAAIFHQVALFASRGWGAALVPASFMAFAVAGVVATYATGMLLERIPSRIGVTLSVGLSALAFGAMFLPLPAALAALVYGTLLGLSSGANAAANSIVWPDYFGVDALGALKGVVNAVRNGATAVGPPLAAMLAASTGSFSAALVLFAAMSALAALFFHAPGWPRGAAQAPAAGDPVRAKRPRRRAPGERAA